MHETICACILYGFESLQFTTDPAHSKREACKIYRQIYSHATPSTGSPLTLNRSRMNRQHSAAAGDHSPHRTAPEQVQAKEATPQSSGDD